MLNTSESSISRRALCKSSGTICVLYFVGFFFEIFFTQFHKKFAKKEERINEKRKETNKSHKRNVNCTVEISIYRRDKFEIYVEK